MKKCKICGLWKTLDAYTIKNQIIMSRSKTCLTCNPDQRDASAPEKAALYVIGFYDEFLEQRFLKVGYSTTSVNERLRALLNSWSEHYGTIPYSKILLEVEVNPLKAYYIEQKVLKELLNSYQLSYLHKNSKIAGQKETFTVQSLSESRVFVDYVKNLVENLNSEDHINV